MYIEFCEYDTLYPLILKDGWDGKVLIHKNTLENNDGWDKFIDELHEAKNKYLKIKEMLNEKGSKNLFFDDSSNQNFFCKYLIVRFLQNYNTYKKEHPEWSDVNEELAVNSFCSDVYSMLEDSYKWFCESRISKDNNANEWVIEYADYMKSIMQSILYGM